MKNIFFSLRSTKGQSLLIAVILTAAAAITTALMFTSAGVTMEASRGPRLRSGMANLETKLRSLMLQPTTFNCPTVGIINDCTLTVAPASLNHQVPGCEGQAPATCGLAIESQTVPGAAADWDPVTRTLSARIRYNGTEANLKPRDVQIVVPTDVLNPIIRCNPGSNSLFLGFDINGVAVCGTVPPSGSSCAPGTFIGSVNTNNFSLTCTPLPALANCAGNTYMDSLSWTGGANLTFTCAPRKDPFAAPAEYVEVVVLGTPPPAYVPSGAPGGPFTNTCTPPPGSCGAPSVARGPLVATASSCSGASCNVGESVAGCFYEPGGFRTCCSPAPVPVIDPPMGTCGTTTYTQSGVNCTASGYTSQPDSAACNIYGVANPGSAPCPNVTDCSTCPTASGSPSCLPGGSACASFGPMMCGNVCCFGGNGTSCNF